MLKSHGQPPVGATAWTESDKHDAIRQFHKLWYDSAEQTWKNIKWMGVPVQKNPMDLWIYTEILHETRPDVIIETGTADGGSALFLAQIANQIKPCDIITIDINTHGKCPRHERIIYMSGNSIGDRFIEFCNEFCRVRHHGNPRVMVILDSDHSKDHVLKEMELYGPLVAPGCYMIVEDGNLHGHPVWYEYGAGPQEAITEYLATHSEFAIDKSREKLMLTFNPNGYLLRTE